MEEKTQRDLLKARLAGFEKFAEWERSHPVSLDPAVAISGISRLYDLLSADARARPLDTSGIREMHRCLAVLRFETQ